MFLQLYSTTKEIKAFSMHKWAFATSFFTLEEKIKDDFNKDKNGKFIYASSGILWIPNKFFYTGKIQEVINQQEYKGMNKLMDYLKKKNIPYQILFKDLILDYDNPLLNTNKFDNKKRKLKTNQDIFELVENFLLELKKNKKKDNILLTNDVINLLVENGFKPYKVFLTKNIGDIQNFQITLRMDKFIGINDFGRIRESLKKYFDPSVLNPSQLRIFECYKNVKRKVGFNFFGTNVIINNKIIYRYKSNTTVHFGNLLKLFREKKFFQPKNPIRLIELSYDYIMSVLNYYYLGTKTNFYAFKVLKELFGTLNEDGIRRIYFKGFKIDTLGTNYYKIIHMNIKSKEKRDIFNQKLKEYVEKQEKELEFLRKKLLKVKEERGVMLRHFFSLHYGMESIYYNNMQDIAKVKVRNLYGYYNKKNKNDLNIDFQLKNKEKKTKVSGYKTLILSNEKIQKDLEGFLTDIEINVVEKAREFYWGRNIKNFQTLSKRSKVYFNKYAYNNIIKNFKLVKKELIEKGIKNADLELIQKLFGYGFQTYGKGIFSFTKKWGNATIDSDGNKNNTKKNLKGINSPITQKNKNKKINNMKRTTFSNHFNYSKNETQIKEKMIKNLTENFIKNYYKGNRHNTLVYSMYYIKNYAKTTNTNIDDLVYLFEKEFEDYIYQYDIDNNNNYKNIKKILN